MGLKEYYASLSPEQKEAIREKNRLKGIETKKRKAADKAEALSQTKGILLAAGISIPEVDRPPQAAIEKVVELAGKRLTLARIKKVFPGISDKAWENLKTHAFKEGIANPNDAGLRIQKNAESHVKVLKKRIKDLKARIADYDSKNQQWNPTTMLEMLHKAEDDLFQVETTAIEKSYRVGAFGNKNKKGSGGITVKFNIPRPPPVIVEKDITPIVIESDD